MKYIRRTIMPKSKFQPKSFRIVDPGRPGHTKLVIGRLKAGVHKGKTRVHQVMWK